MEQGLGFMNRLKQGDTIAVKPHHILGTPATTGTVLSVESYGYIVHIKGDDPLWYGPVDFEGNVLQEGP